MWLNLFKKDIEVFQWPLKSKQLKQTVEMKQNHIFSGDIAKSDIIFFYQKIFRYFSDFQNQNFSVLWLHWTQEMKEWDSRN